MGTYFSSSEERAEQAIHDMGENTRLEIDALRCLTQAGCSSSPALLGWKRETQSNTDWVPGGVYRIYPNGANARGQTATLLATHGSGGEGSASKSI